MIVDSVERATEEQRDKSMTAGWSWVFDEFLCVVRVSASLAGVVDAFRTQPPLSMEGVPCAVLVLFLRTYCVVS
jgi:hypothetical protein